MPIESIIEYTLHSNENLDQILSDAQVHPNLQAQGLKPVLSMHKDEKKYSFLNFHGWLQ